MYKRKCPQCGRSMKLSSWDAIQSKSSGKPSDKPSSAVWLCPPCINKSMKEHKEVKNV